jgi:hypothetical protein
MPTLARRERVAEGRVRGFCAAATGIGNRFDRLFSQAIALWRNITIKKIKTFL